MVTLLLTFLLYDLLFPSVSALFILASLCPGTHFDHFNAPPNKQITFLFSMACSMIPRNTFRVIKVASAWIHKTMDRTKYNRRNIRRSCPLRGRRQSRSYFALLRTVIPLRAFPSKKKRSFLARGETSVMTR